MSVPKIQRNKIWHIFVTLVKQTKIFGVYTVQRDSPAFCFEILEGSNNLLIFDNFEAQPDPRNGRCSKTAFHMWTSFGISIFSFCSKQQWILRQGCLGVRGIRDVLRPSLCKLSSILLLDSYLQCAKRIDWTQFFVLIKLWRLLCYHRHHSSL